MMALKSATRARRRVVEVRGGEDQKKVHYFRRLFWA